MQQLAKLLNNETGLVQILGKVKNPYAYKGRGFEMLDVEKSDINGHWYLTGKCPKKTAEQKLAEAKQLKLAESKRKLKETRYGQTFTVTLQEKECVFDTSEETQRDLSAAGLVTATGAIYPDWTTNNGVKLDLTQADLITVFNAFFARVSPLYTLELAYIKEIENARTVEEVEAVEIEY